MIIAKQPWKILSEDDPLWYSWGWYSIGMAEMIKWKY